jgi:hypothetical protein
VRTYELITVERDLPAIRCLLCGGVSVHRMDVRAPYCGHCHMFHDAVEMTRDLHADGSGHECSEWRTAIDTCAICGPLLAKDRTA